MKNLMLAAFAAFSLAAAVAPMANAASVYSHNGNSAVRNSGSQFVGGGDGGNG